MVDYGKTMLPNYYKEKLTEWNKEVLLEESIKVFWKDISLNGKIDKVEFNGNSVKVVDYKTGKIANVNKFGSDEAPISEEALAQSIAEHKEIKDSEKFGGDYWRQAVFYKILIDNDPNRNWNVEEAIFEFMEVDKKTNKYPLIKIIVTPIHEQIVKEQILFTYTGIKNKQFDGCGKIDCEWCSFLSDKLKVEQRRY